MPILSNVDYQPYSKYSWGVDIEGMHLNNKEKFTVSSRYDSPKYYRLKTYLKPEGGPLVST